MEVSYKNFSAKASVQLLGSGIKIQENKRFRPRMGGILFRFTKFLLIDIPKILEVEPAEMKVENKSYLSPFRATIFDGLRNKIKKQHHISIKYEPRCND